MDTPQAPQAGTADQVSEKLRLTADVLQDIAHSVSNVCDVLNDIDDMPPLYSMVYEMLKLIGWKAEEGHRLAHGMSWPQILGDADEWLLGPHWKKQKASIIVAKHGAA